MRIYLTIHKREHALHELGNMKICNKGNNVICYYVSCIITSCDSNCTS